VVGGVGRLVCDPLVCDPLVWAKRPWVLLNELCGQESRGPVARVL